MTLRKQNKDEESKYTNEIEKSRRNCRIILKCIKYQKNEINENNDLFIYLVKWRVC